jgi:hypothetical protein
MDREESRGVHIVLLARSHDPMAVEEHELLSYGRSGINSSYDRTISGGHSMVIALSGPPRRHRKLARFTAPSWSPASHRRRGDRIHPLCTSSPAIGDALHPKF